MEATGGLTYLMLHLIFLAPALVIGGFFGRVAYKKRPNATLLGILILTVVAVLYTTPWDNYLIEIGVWDYGDGAVFVTLWNAPLGEYMFFIIQSLVTGFWASYLFRHEFTEEFYIDPVEAVLGGAAGIGVLAVGVWLYLSGGQMTYMGALLAWAGPVLALQWGFGWRTLWRHRKRAIAALAAPTLYLFAIDRIAIFHNLWYLSPDLTTGFVIPALGLPIEEAVFFVVTNLFLVQGLLLFYWVIDTTSLLESSYSED